MAQAVRIAGMVAAAGAIAAFAGPAAAQVTPGSQQGLGLTGANIPALLKQVQADPYRAPADPACDTIPQEILALDKVLGPDVDGPKVKTGMGHMAVDYARHAIPYRGWVRFLTRADSKDKALQAAATAGFARRGFLRGLEAHLRCSGPDAAGLQTASAPVDLTAQIRPTAVVADNSARVSSSEGDHLVKLMLVAAPTSDASADTAGAPDGGAAPLATAVQGDPKPAPDPAGASGR